MSVLGVGGVEVDLGRREARVDGAVVPLATREFDLLAFLAENEGLVLSPTAAARQRVGPRLVRRRAHRRRARAPAAQEAGRRAAARDGVGRRLPPRLTATRETPPHPRDPRHGRAHARAGWPHDARLRRDRSPSLDRARSPPAGRRRRGRSSRAVRGQHERRPGAVGRTTAGDPASAPTDAPVGGRGADGVRSGRQHGRRAA